jgi:hypothetical protein
MASGFVRPKNMKKALLLWFECHPLLFLSFLSFKKKKKPAQVPQSPPRDLLRKHADL